MPDFEYNLRDIFKSISVEEMIEIDNAPEVDDLEDDLIAGIAGATCNCEQCIVFERQMESKSIKERPPF